MRRKRNAKSEVIPFNEFMAQGLVQGELEHKRKATTKKIAKVVVMAGVSVLCIGFGDVSFAMANMIDGVVADKVARAFTPLIDLVRALSYPIGLTMMLGGGLFVMIGNSEKGISMIQKAGMGYVLIQMLPILMDLLVEIAKSL